MGFLPRSTSLVIVVVLLLTLEQCSHVNGATRWRLWFERSLPPMEMGEHFDLKFRVENLNETELKASSATIRLTSEDSNIVSAYRGIPLSEIHDGTWNGSVLIEAIFIGGADIFVEIHRQIGNEHTVERSYEHLRIQVTRKKVPLWMYKEMFNIFEYVLYITIGIIFGMAIDWHKVGAHLKKPIGIGISFFCSYIFMPLTGYALGFILFPDNSELQFVIFITGACILKSISNMWTVVLKGNIDLSVTITIIHTFLACGMLPLWILTLGNTKFSDADLTLQTKYFVIFVVKGVIPLGLGAIIKQCVRVPNKYLIILLRILSIIYIAFIIIHDAAMGFDLISAKFVITWKFFLTGFLLPLLGYTCASLLAYAFRQNHEDRVAIAVDTINFNLVIASSTSQTNIKLYTPTELTTFLSNLLSIMTPIPLLIHLIWMKTRGAKTV